MTAVSLLKRAEILEQQVGALEALPARVDALSAQILQFRTETREEFSAVRAEIRAGDEETRALMIALNQETRTHMLVLHEQLVERIKWMGEGNLSVPRRGGTPTTRRTRKKPRE